MKALAVFIMRGRLHAGGVVVVCAALALVLPPLAYLSAAGVGLVTLRAGAAQGLLVMGGAGAALALLGLLTLGGPALGIAYAVLVWLPVWGLAVILNRTGSLAFTMGCTALMGALLVSAVHLWSADPVAVWRTVLESGLRPALEQAGVAHEPAQMDQLLSDMARMMTALIAATMVISFCVSLFLARWWQALLYNADGFQTEFHALRFGRVFAPPVVVLVIAGVVAQGVMRQWLVELIAVVVAVYMFQGLAFVHRTVALRNAHRMWLVAVYGLLLVMLPQMSVALAIAGLLYSVGFTGAVSGDRPGNS
ncbi:MAG: hypothetical protein O2845_05235 [Proteobacteria bacterium]|nr:hypothetical protein [Pseudomonadota bacterium]